jgi:hypothetical protein
LSIKVTAQQIKRLGSTEYLFAIPISLALELLEIPDPAHPFVDNRRVSKKHAMDFGNYWENYPTEWVVPPILLDTSEELKFNQMKKDNDQIALVDLQLPADHKHSLRILDGQHRILGWYLKKLELDARLSEATSSYNKAVIASANSDKLIIQNEISLINRHKARLDEEHVSINLIDSLTPKKHQQFFVDIAKNALGINKTVQAKFDSASIINRVTQELIKTHPLFIDRIDMEKTSCSGSNPNFLTVVNVSDISRHACFGVNRMVTAKRENNYKDSDLIEVVTIFLDLMVKNVRPLQLVVDGRIKPSDFRDQYMLGSGTIWRCLAGAFYEACVIIDDDEGTIELDEDQQLKFGKMIKSFSENMQLPISAQWFATTLFPVKRSKAPSSRAQDLESMVGLLTAWSRNGRLFFPKTPSGLQ